MLSTANTYFNVLSILIYSMEWDGSEFPDIWHRQSITSLSREVFNLGMLLNDKPNDCEQLSNTVNQ